MAESSETQVSPASVAVHTVEVSADREGQRLDNFLLGHLKGAPRSLIYRLLRTGQVRVNGGRVKPERRLEPGDKVRIPPVRLPEASEAAPVPRGLLDDLEQRIILEDRNLLVIDKASGLASHGGSGINVGAIEALRALRPRDTLELVHRLDRDTSGVLVLSRRRSALLRLQEAMREGKVRKTYLALLAGKLPQARITVREALRKSTLRGGERMVVVDPEGKPSTSHFKVLAQNERASLVEIHIDTGRTHQIRVHAAHLGHPVAGDDKYGLADFNRELKTVGLRRLFLHAAALSFRLGEDGPDYSLSAPLPDELSSVLNKLGL